VYVYDLQMLFCFLYLGYVYNLYFIVCKFRSYSETEDTVGLKHSNHSNTSPNRAVDDTLPSTTKMPNSNNWFRDVNCSLDALSLVSSWVFAIICVVWAVFQIRHLYLAPLKLSYKGWGLWVHRFTMIAIGVTIWPALKIGDIFIENYADSTILFHYPIASVMQSPLNISL